MGKNKDRTYGATCPAGIDHALPQAPTAEGRPDDAPDLQEALRQAQANLLRYQEMFDFAPDGNLETDVHAVIQQANYAAAAMLGSRREFLAGKPLLFYVAEGDRRAFTDRLRLLARQSESRLQWEATLVPPRALCVPVLITATSAQPLDHPAAIRWAIRDVSRLKQAERTLIGERDFADSLIEMAGAIILVLDYNGRVVRTNPYVCSLMGRGPDKLEGRPLLDLLEAEDRPAARESLAALAAGDHNARGVHRWLARDGRTRTVAWSARLLAAEPVGHDLILLVGNDVTDLQEAQQRALQAERLAAIGQMSAGLAHESRNALQRSQACLALLGFRLQGNPEALALLARAQKAQEDLHHLYEDVQEYAGPIHLERRPCSLSDVWRQAWDDLSPVREGKDAVLAEETAGVDLECTVSPFHLRQVFRNLFENALAAAGAKARITVRCKAVRLDGREAVQTAVQDNGPGFTREAQRAFEAFYTTKVRGTGLGLAISKRIIEAHGGRIAVGESAEPGALLLLTLPRRPK